MINTKEKDMAVNLARKYRVKRLYLFGSVLKKHGYINDYDFAVEGYPSGKFFDFYGELYNAMPKEVDLIDLSLKNPRLNASIKKEAKLLYESKRI